ncbi:LOW QUALITY PROTEIN: gasdermin-B [Eptesicus fuscus]|uniref:LOW QUALITY PROTEIN: gasdermin-B n=1 Tax=Eptesicus fuscus TaxID=29078 RepID=UPI0024041908|nr:LOW QUALITY PROTEIN: gasdermin-B [Eptesicus fuscus]
MPSVFKTIARAVVQELDAAGDMIEVRSVLDADKFHCFCLVMGTNTRHFYRTDLTLEDILESDEGEGQCDELDFGLPGSKAEFQALDVVDSTRESTGKLPRGITIEGASQESHEHDITMLRSTISQQYLDPLQDREAEEKITHFVLSMQTRGEGLYLVTETLETTKKKETLTSEWQFKFWSLLKFFNLKYERKHQRAVTIPPKLVLGYRVKQLVFPNVGRMRKQGLLGAGKTKSFPEEEDGGSSCLGKSLNLEDLRNMKEKVQDTVSGLQDLTEEEREDVLSYLIKCLTTDEELRISQVLTSGELQMEGPAGPLLSSLFNAGILVEARAEAILEFLEALKELSEEKELMAETLKKGTLPLLKDQVESLLEQNWGEQPCDVGCDLETLYALYVAISILLQLSEKPASVPSC